MGRAPSSTLRNTGTWRCGADSSASFAPTRSPCFASALAAAPARPPQCSSAQERSARTCTPCFGTLLAPQRGLPSPTRSPRPPRLSTCTEQLKQSAGRSHRRQTCPPRLPPRRGQPASSSHRLLSAASAYARGPVVDGCSSTPPDGADGASWPPVATAKKLDGSPQSTKTPRDSSAHHFVADEDSPARTASPNRDLRRNALFSALIRTRDVAGRDARAMTKAGLGLVVPCSPSVAASRLKQSIEALLVDGPPQAGGAGRFDRAAPGRPRRYGDQSRTERVCGYGRISSVRSRWRIVQLVGSRWSDWSPSPCPDAVARTGRLARLPRGVTAGSRKRSSLAQSATRHPRSACPSTSRTSGAPQLGQSISPSASCSPAPRSPAAIGTASPQRGQGVSSPAPVVAAWRASLRGI